MTDRLIYENQVYCRSEGGTVVQNYSQELGLLRTIIRGMETRAMRANQITHKYLRAECMALAHPVGDGVIVLNRAATDAFDDLSESVVTRSSGMERGATFKSVCSELLNVLASYVGSDADSVNADTVATLHSHLEEWLSQRTASHQVFIPCAIFPGKAEPFSIGPVLFIYMDDVTRSDFYLSSDDLFHRGAFDDMLASMKVSRAHWLACVSIEHCDEQRGQEIGALAADLAIVGLQLALPLFWNTRRMSRLDVRRGEAEAHTIMRSGSSYSASYSNLDAGVPIGPGMIAKTLQIAAPVIEAVGKCVTSFATGQFRLPKLEQAWCDAAYWLHEALVETSDAIAFAKLETALEVLVSAENTSGSGSRIELILAAFYSLSPNDMLTSESTTTAKQFARGMVQDRSRILHGTWSTLNPRLGMDRQGMEQFVIEVIRRAAVELEAYANTTAPTDEIEPFLMWVKPERNLQASGVPCGVL
jgi:hypothetical protein